MCIGLWGLLSVFACVSFASFYVLFLRFSFPFLFQYSVVLYARDCSCTMYVHKNVYSTKGHVM